MIRSVVWASVVFLLSIPALGPAFGQAPSVPPAFEVASVKVSSSGQPSASFKNGRLMITNTTLRTLISAAYGVTEDSIRGAPLWLESDRFDVAAKIDPTSSQDESRLMLQTLLAKRFRLKVHHEQKTIAAYGLTVVKEGPKVQPTPADSTVRSECDGTQRITCHRIGMAALAMMLPNIARPDIDLPVTDLTSLKGFYDFQLYWTPTTDGGLGPSIFDALQEQLGLKLERGKHSIDYLVVDQVERVPTGN